MRLTQPSLLLGITALAGIALASTADAAEKKNILNFFEKNSKKAALTQTAGPTTTAPLDKTAAASNSDKKAKSGSAESSSMIRRGALEAPRVYAIPKDPNRFIVKIPQAPRSLAATPQTAIVKKPERKEIPRS